MKKSFHLRGQGGATALESGTEGTDEPLSGSNGEVADRMDTGVAGKSVPESEGGRPAGATAGQAEKERRGRQSHLRLRHANQAVCHAAADGAPFQPSQKQGKQSGKLGSF